MPIREWIELKIGHGKWSEFSLPAEFDQNWPESIKNDQNQAKPNQDTFFIMKFKLENWTKS